MPLKNWIILDFSLDKKSIFILKKKKLYKKKIISLKRSENIANIFFGFIKKSNIKIDNSFILLVNLGPGNIIAVRNSIVFAKTISLIFGCKIVGFSNYQLAKLKKITGDKVILTLQGRILLLDTSKKKVTKISLSELKKSHYTNFKFSYNKKILKKLTLSINHIKKVFPISYSDV